MTVEDLKQMQRKLLFNPEGNDELTGRKIIGGETTNIFNLNNVKYTWANRLYRNMMENFWIPEKVDLTMDVLDYQKLTKQERRAYDGILSFLVFLDSIQTNNVPKISEYITAPEVNLVLAIQTYQEAIHSQSYAYTIETIIPVEKRNEIYEFWRDDQTLFERIKFIAKAYQDFHDNDSKINFLKAVIADYLLEAIYFYNGFNFFYLLASRNLMPGTADIIRFINRDELSHVVLFQNVILNIKEENPTKEEIQSWIDRGVELKKLFNTSGMLYRELNVKEKRETYTEEQLIELLASNGMLVKRPIVIQGDNIIIGNKVSEYENLQK